MMLRWILFASTYIALGALLILFSSELASALDNLAVKFYGLFPALKRRVPLSRLAGTEANYHTSRVYFRVLGVLMLLGGALFLGAVVLRHH